MRWPEACGSLTSVAMVAFVIAIAIPRASLNRARNKIQDPETINKTLRDNMNKNRFIEKFLTSLKESHLANINNTLNHAHTTTELDQPNIVYSDSLAKNLLTFQFKPEVIFGRKTIVRMILYFFVDKKENKGNMKAQSNQPPLPTSRDFVKANSNNGGKNKKVKIIIFLVSTNGSRIQKVAELKKTFSHSQWERVGLPLYLLSKVAEAHSNNTLYLRVECKKCNKKTQLDLPSTCERRHRLRKTKHGRHRGNRNCNASATHKPFIMIESKSQVLRRNKRNSESDCDVRAPNAVNRTQVSHSECCHPSRTFVEINDLNLDHIVIWPSTIELLTCGGTCGHTSLAKSQSHLRRSVDKRVDSSRLKLSSSDIIRRNYHQHLHSPEIQLRNQLRRKNRSLYHHKWTRPKSSNTCVPLETQDLVLLHFAPDQTLAQTRIPNLLITKCGCKADPSRNVN